MEIFDYFGYLVSAYAGIVVKQVNPIECQCSPVKPSKTKFGPIKPSEIKYVLGKPNKTHYNP